MIRFLVGMTMLLTPSIPNAKPVSNCVSVEHRALHYWVGEWEIRDAKTNERFADNRVEIIHDGCVIREELSFPDGRSATGFTAYDPIDKVWRQVYVDSSGAFFQIQGPIRPDGSLLLEGKVRPPRLPRAGIGRQISKRIVGGFTQTGFFSEDGGRTWRQVYDLKLIPNPTSRQASKNGGGAHAERD